MTSINLTFNSNLPQNFGSGCETVQRPKLPGDTIQTPNAYIKFYASDLVRSDGTYNFSSVLSALDQCKLAGAKMYTRIALVDPAGQDLPVAWQSRMRVIAFTSQDSSPVGRQLHFPDCTDQRAIDELSKFLTGFYGVVKDHPAFGGIDAYWHGLWGEGHFSGCVPNPMPSLAVRQNFLSLLSGMISPALCFACLDDNDACRFALVLGMGWRQDGAGNPKHMTTFIPTWLAAVGGQDTWTKARCAFEIYGKLTDALWSSPGSIFNELLRYNPSLVNLKSVSPPVGQVPAVNSFLSAIGFQPFIKTVSWPDTVYAGDLFPLTLTLRNVGCAPSYEPLKLLIANIPFYPPRIYPGEEMSVTASLCFPYTGTYQMRAKLQTKLGTLETRNVSYDQGSGDTLLGTITVQQRP